VGAPNGVATPATSTVASPSRCLLPGDSYEIEGAVDVRSDERAATAAAVQDTVRAAWQLTPPIDPELLAERTPAIKCIEAVDVPVLNVAGARAEQALGIKVNYGVAPLVEDVGTLRRAVRAIRDDGWTGAILLPGYAPGLLSIVIPRAFAHGGRLRVSRYAMDVPVPAAVVDYALGRLKTLPTAYDFKRVSFRRSAPIHYGSPRVFNAIAADRAATR
jgi:hypothetical protein